MKRILSHTARGSRSHSSFSWAGARSTAHGSLTRRFAWPQYKAHRPGKGYAKRAGGDKGNGGSVSKPNPKPSSGSDGGNNAHGTKRQ